jgi:hypothetical protein
MRPAPIRKALEGGLARNFLGFAADAGMSAGLELWMEA